MTVQINQKDEHNTKKVFIMVSCDHVEYWRTKKEAVEVYRYAQLSSYIHEQGAYIWVSEDFYNQIEFEEGLTEEEREEMKGRSRFKYR